MLSDRARIILFWFTIGLMVLVAVLAAITILRACGGPTPRGPALTIKPAEVSVCPGEQRQFTVEEDVGVGWEATGGAISEDGLFSAGDAPGEHTVTAVRDDSGQAASAVVHIVACTPKPTLAPSPTPFPTSTPTAAPSPSPYPDAQGDVGTYEEGAAVETPPPGVDIRTASVSRGLEVTLQPTDEAPKGLSGWVSEGEMLLWISMHEDIPDPPRAYVNWLFVLDLDGKTDTGRPPGSRRINPDLGDETAVGVSYNPATEAYEPYSLVWDAAEEDWASGPDVRYKIDESRTVVGLALSLDELEQDVSQASGAAIAPEAVKGRSAAETYMGEQRVIDFYPDLPE